MRSSEASAASATLICLEDEHEATFRFGYGVQHRGLAFREEEDGMIHPTLHGWEADPLDGRLGRDEERGAVAAACLLVERDAYESVGGFTHGFVYGGEDIDICLKLREDGCGILCSGRSLAIHHPVSTRRRAPFEEERARKLANRRLLWERWGPRLRREYELDLLDGGGLWAEAHGAGGTGARDAASDPQPARVALEALGFCVKVAEPDVTIGLGEIAAALRSAGHRCILLEGSSAEDAVGLNYDVAVHIHSGTRYVPKPAQLNVLWLTDANPPTFVIECANYDLLVGSSANLLRVRGEQPSSSPAQATLSGTDPAALAAQLATAVSEHARQAGFRTRIGSPASLSQAVATQ
jgi:hypothetical protein